MDEEFVPTTRGIPLVVGSRMKRLRCSPEPGTTPQRRKPTYEITITSLDHGHGGHRGPPVPAQEEEEGAELPTEVGDGEEASSSSPGRATSNEAIPTRPLTG